MSNQPLPQSEIILYQTEDGRTRIQCLLENETVWLTQALIADLFQKDVRTINEHLVYIFSEGELTREATIRKFRIVRHEGARQVNRGVEHYNLDAILAVGFRVRSLRGTQFRQWATARLSEYLVKGFELFFANEPCKNKRPQQSPKPNVDRESPVLGGKGTKRYTNLPSLGCGCGWYLTGPARIFCEMPFTRRKRNQRGQLGAGATIRKFRRVRSEGSREVKREIEHYNFQAFSVVARDTVPQTLLGDALLVAAATGKRHLQVRCERS